MMNRLFALVMLLVIGCGANDERVKADAELYEKFGSLFGLRIGEVLDDAKPNENLRFKVAFTPKMQFRNFSNYGCNITPLSHKVYQIGATEVLKNQSTAECGAVLKVLSEKYRCHFVFAPKIRDDFEIASAIGYREGKTRELDFHVSYFGGFDNEIGMSIVLTDNDLQKVAEKEKLEMLQKRINEKASGKNNGLDAL